MTRVITGTATIGATETIVTAWAGQSLTEINCPPGSPVVIEGMANFVKARLDGLSFELELPHAGAGGAGLATAISAMTPTEVSAGTLNGRVAATIQQLNVLDANGRGLFYNLIGVTGDNDPGPGRMAMNNADPALVTELYLDVLDANDGGRDVAGLIGLWQPGTVLIVRSLASAAYAAFQLTLAPVDAGGYRRVQVEQVGADGTLAAEPVAVEWRISGSGLQIGAAGPFAERVNFDAEAEGFVYASVDGDGAAITTSVLFRRQAASPGGWSDPMPFEGPPGKDSVVPGPIGPAGSNWLDAWDSATAYVINDVVENNGSSWRATTDNTNQPPPVLPTKSNAYWYLVSAAGKDGTGTGDMVGPAGVTDGAPAQFDGTTGKLTKAGAFADQSAAEAGTDNAAFMTPLRTAQAILALSPSPAELETTVSMLALQVADISNVALFLGPTGNRVADHFVTLTYVDVAGGTNLDTSMAGVLKPSSGVGGVDSYAKLMLHCDGADGSTTMVDSSIAPKTVTAGGGAQIDTAQSKFGGASALFDGAGDYLTVAGSADWNIGAGDFTFDVWFRPASFAALQYILDARDPGNIADNSKRIVLIVDTSGTLNLSIAAANITPNGTLSLDTWHHIAIVRNSGVVTYYLDGTAKGTQAIAQAFDFSAITWKIGASYVPGGYLSGHLDEFRLSNGIARWTTNFMPPTQAYVAPPLGNLTVSSAALTAAAPPTKMTALLLVKEVDAAIAGTDYTLECSRDGGTTWAAMALTELFTAPTTGLRVVAAAETDVSGQPSGAAPRWRFKTLTNKNVWNDATNIYWS